MIFDAAGLVFRYPDAESPALDGVSVRVEPGSLLALAGPNGSGKTSLLRILLGILQPSAGQVTLDGRPLGAWPRTEIARRVGVVAQREDVWVPLTVEEVVSLGRYPHLGPLAPLSPEDRRIAAEAMALCDVTRFGSRMADTLSGGEWQRVRIARALAQQPAALVLDEPGTALDVRHEMEVMELVRRLVDGGIACLLITHHLNIVARYADRMLLLDQGRPRASGTPTEVLREEILTEVFGWPIAVTTWEGVPQIVPRRLPGPPPGRPVGGN